MVCNGDISPTKALSLREKYLEEVFSDIERNLEINKYEYIIKNGTADGYKKYGKYYDEMYGFAKKNNPNGFEKSMQTAMTEAGLDEKTAYEGMRDVFRDSLKAGEITPEKATEYVTNYGGQDAGTAYWTVQGWLYKNAGNEGEFSKYDRLSISVISGNGYEVAVSELLDHGTKESTITTETRNAIKAAYVGSSITPKDANSLLKKYGFAKDDNAAYWQIREWDYYIANGTSEGYGMYRDFLGSIKIGGSSMKAYAKELVDHGIEKGDAAKQVTAAYKAEYLSLKATSSSATQALLVKLLVAYEALGYDRDYQYNRYIKKWKLDD